MPTVQIDDEVFSHLQRHAIPLIDTPNATLRRLLGIDGAEGFTEPDEGTPGSPSAGAVAGRRRRPKVNLPTLVRHGTLRNSQTLHLVDYQGNKVPGSESTISGNRVVWHGDAYSMSELARQLLKERGYTGDSVRGPQFWVTSRGESVVSLWEKYLDSIA